MRVLLWHGYLLEGSGTNVFTARVAEALRDAGHDVLLLCQEGHPERYPWIDAWGSVDAGGPSALTPNPTAAPAPGGGRCVLLRPVIGELLPVFVFDRYEGFEVKTFVDLHDDELDRYLARNVEALRAAAAWHGTETTYADHSVPGGPVAARALPAGSYVLKTAGSDVEYALRPQRRYRDLAAEGIRAARALVGPSRDGIARIQELTGTADVPARIVTPGVDVERFRPRDRRAALLDAADRLDGTSETAAGRPSDLDREVAAALDARDAGALDTLADAYDQRVPDPDAAARLRRLADRDRPLVAVYGKLIHLKGPHLALTGAALAGARPDVAIVGFGRWREWLVAVAVALARGDAEALAWLRDREALPPEAPIDRLAVAAGPPDVAWTGRLDHRFAPEVLAAADVLVVPSILDEAFGMVAAEGAASGALPLVARHSGLAEVASALADDAGRTPETFSFEPGPGAIERIAAGIDTLLAIPADERRDLADAFRRSIDARWSWREAAERLLG